MSTVAKSPSMPFYGRQFYDDESVWLSSLAHQGLYVALLWHQWSEGSIPADVRKIAQLVGQTERDVKRLWDVVGNWFPLVENTDRRRNPQLERVREDMVRLRERRASSGSKGGSKTAASRVANSEAKSVPPYGEGEGEATSLSSKEGCGEEFDVATAFASAWESYPRKVGKHDAQRHFKAQVRSRSDFAAFESAVQNYREEVRVLATSDEYVKHGSTFFNHVWRDYVDGVWQRPKPKTPPSQPNLPTFVRRIDS